MRLNFIYFENRVNSWVNVKRLDIDKLSSIKNSDSGLKFVSGNLHIGENLPFCMKKGLTLIVSNL